MKKTFLFMLLAMASSSAAFAQARSGGSTTSKDYTGGTAADSRNTGFGIKGGYSLSNFYGSGKDFFPGSRNNLHTFHAGAYGQFGFDSFSSIQVELLYSRKGIQTDNGNAGKSNLRLDYFSLPVLYVGNVTENISFHIGPEISLLTKVKNGDKNEDLGANGYNSIDFGGVAGLEARIGPARLGVRYDLGLGRVIKENTVVVGSKGTDSSIRNQTLQVYVGIGLSQ
jgi:hypothetical protein